MLCSSVTAFKLTSPNTLNHSKHSHVFNNLAIGSIKTQARIRLHFVNLPFPTSSARSPPPAFLFLEYQQCQRTRHKHHRFKSASTRIARIPAQGACTRKNPTSGLPRKRNFIFSYQRKFVKANFVPVCLSSATALVRELIYPPDKGSQARSQKNFVFFSICPRQSRGAVDKTILSIS